MSDPDPLAEIKAQLSDGPLQLGSGQRIEGAANLDEDQADWLVGEVTRLRALLEPSVTMTSPYRTEARNANNPAPPPEG